MTYKPAYMALERERDEKVRQWIKEIREHEERLPTRTPWTNDQIAGEVATYLVEDDVARGEYEGCSIDMEIAYSDHCARVERILREN